MASIRSLNNEFYDSSMFKSTMVTEIITHLKQKGFNH